ncbi:MAG: ATP synthase F1 subunit epsilon [Clostridiales bacterium]|nr:ATP synthase F1 subunit epsilon [Clostridiales bacterium]MCC8099946.1 ATP synthase F1 subunit epsilon [Clostridiales bacterium]
MAAEFHLEVLASDRVFYNGPCESVTIPALDGELGILAGHSELVTAIDPGMLRFQVPGEQEQHIAAVGAGFAHVNRDRVWVLVETAERPEEIDENRARRAYEQAQEELRQRQSMQEYQLTQANLARAMNRLKVKRGERF